MLLVKRAYAVRTGAASPNYCYKQGSSLEKNSVGRRIISWHRPACSSSRSSSMGPALRMALAARGAEVAAGRAVVCPYYYCYFY